MMVKEVHLALGVMSVFLGFMVLGLRIISEPSHGTICMGDCQREDLCVGVLGPRQSLGIICTKTLEDIPERAVALMGLPKTCRHIPSPTSYLSGHYLYLKIKDGSCEADESMPLKGMHRLLMGKGIDINRGGAQELRILPGIGSVRAASIVRFRQDFGHFTCPDDLLRIKGIGKQTVKRLLPWLESSQGVFKRDCPLPDPWTDH